MFDDIFKAFGDDAEDFELGFLEAEMEAEMNVELYNEYLLKSAPANDSNNLFFELDENSAISF